MQSTVDPRSLKHPHLCLCGCNKVTPLAPYTKPQRNWVRGCPMAFMPHHSKVKYPVVDGMKECAECHKTLPVSSFWRNKSRADRYQHRCKECSKAHVYGWREGNVKYVAYRQNGRLEKYKITPNQYDAMSEAQGWLCAICNQPERSRFKGKLRRLAVDHCHETGRVRGLLCCSCNRALGYFGDDAKRLEAAVAYLRKENDSG